MDSSAFKSITAKAASIGIIDP